MRVLIDTSVWSLALRRDQQVDSPVVAELIELIREARGHLIGPVRQELLSGIKNKVQFQKLRNHLRAFPDLDITARDYESAADFYNICRAKGIQGSNTDFLICAVAVRCNITIFTTDEDFTLFKTHVPIRLHPPRS